MHLILHTGVHFAEEERLMKCLLRNADDFARAGVAVPGPGKYRGLLRETLNAMTRGPTEPGARDVLMDAILDDRTADRMILSDANFFRLPAFAVQDGMLYPSAAVRVMRLAQLFAEDRIEIFMAIRNPATLLPMLYQKAQGKDDAAFWGTATRP